MFNIRILKLFFKHSLSPKTFISYLHSTRLLIQSHLELTKNSNLRNPFRNLHIFWNIVDVFYINFPQHLLGQSFKNIHKNPKYILWKYMNRNYSSQTEKYEPISSTVQEILDILKNVNNKKNIVYCVSLKKDCNKYNTNGLYTFSIVLIILSHLNQQLQYLKHFNTVVPLLMLIWSLYEYAFIYNILIPKSW